MTGKLEINMGECLKQKKAEWSSNGLIILIIWHHTVMSISVETVVSVGYIGLSSLPAGLLQNRIGPRWMSMVALILSTLGSALCWMAFQNKQFHTDHFTIFAFYYFLMGKYQVDIFSVEDRTLIFGCSKLKCLDGMV